MKIIYQFTLNTNSYHVLITNFYMNSAGLNLQVICQNIHLFSTDTFSSVIKQAFGRMCYLGQTKSYAKVEGTFQVGLARKNQAKALLSLILEFVR